MTVRLLWVLLLVEIASSTAIPAQVVRRLTDFGKPEEFRLRPGSLSDDGAVLVVASEFNWFGDNPGRVNQPVVWDTQAGTGNTWGALRYGVEDIAVSDDGLWIAFTSTSDPVDGNPDRSAELFLATTDGATIVQLTDGPALQGGARLPVLTAGASKIVFVGSFDPLGQNPGLLEQVFSISSDGSGLTQITQLDASDWPIRGLAVSDDGQRIAFIRQGDLANEGIAPSQQHLFAIEADGSNLRSIAGDECCDVTTVAMSGNGEKIVFTQELLDNPDAIATIRLAPQWGSGSVVDIQAGNAGSIRADGKFLYFASAEGDDNSEIWVAQDAQPPTKLTDTAPPLQHFNPIVSDDGSLIVFEIEDGAYPGGNNTDGGRELAVMNADGTSPAQISEGVRTVEEPFDTVGSLGISGDGTTAVVISARDPLGSNPTGDRQLFAFSTETGAMTQVTSGFLNIHRRSRVALDGPGSRAFIRVWDNGNYAVRSINMADGSGFLLNSACEGDCHGWDPAVALTGGTVTYASVIAGDYGVSRANLDGSGDQQIYGGVGGFISEDTVDVSPDGEWILFRDWSVDGLRLIRADGTTVATFPSEWYDGSVSDDGRVIYVARDDPLGLNPDGGWEHFLYDVPSQSLTQLTDGLDSIRPPDWSPDGEWYYYDFHRRNVTTGAVERVLGLNGKPAESTKLDGTGTKLLIRTWRHWPAIDSHELYLVDYATPALIRPGAAAPTVVTWDEEPAFQFYSVLRGDVADLALVGNETRLSSAICVERRSYEVDTIGDEDVEQPGPGQVFYYLYRGYESVQDASVSWGTNSAGGERVDPAGGCD